MGKNSKIEWTHHTFSPWRGCIEKRLGDGSMHPACVNCYARNNSRRRPIIWGKWGDEQKGTRVLAAPAYWREPIAWNFEAMTKKVRRRVFCASVSDVFEDWTGPIHNHRGSVLYRSTDGWVLGPDNEDPRKQVTMQDVRGELFKLIDQTPWLDWLLLTKRPENVQRMWCSHVNTDGRPPSKLHRPNVWLGTSVSNQETAEQLVPPLLKLRELSDVLFLSIEPLLGPIDDLFLQREPQGIKDALRLAEARLAMRLEPVDWVIVGGESGRKARPMHPDWVRGIRQQCQAIGVPFFFKQWGEWEPLWEAGGIVAHSGKGKTLESLTIDGKTTVFQRVGKKAAGRELDGREWSEFPEVSIANV